MCNEIDTFTKNAKRNEGDVCIHRRIIVSTHSQHVEQTAHSSDSRHKDVCAPGPANRVKIMTQKTICNQSRDVLGVMAGVCVVLGMRCTCRQDGVDELCCSSVWPG